MTDGRCLDCGAVTGGLRCKPCHGAEQRRIGLEQTRDHDDDILRMVDVEGINGARLAIRLGGVSKTAAYNAIRRARTRRAQREAGGDGLTESTSRKGNGS